MVPKNPSILIDFNEISVFICLNGRKPSKELRIENIYTRKKKKKEK